MKLIFRHRLAITQTAFSFVFIPAEPVSWIAGQSIRLEILAPDYGTNERRFTISSAPYEAAITITTRRSASEFKQSLFSLQPGDVIDGYAIEGNLSWSSTDNPLFVATGIGITPFYSMLKQRLHEQQPIKTTLFYGHKNDDAPFSKDLDSWQHAHPEFILKRLAGQRITSGVLYQAMPELRPKTIYLSGPSAFVDELRQELIHEFGINECAIKGDWFTGNVPVL